MLEDLIDRYIAAWNEADPAARRALVARTWTDGACYLDPMMAGEGHDGIDAMIGAAQGQFPGLTFTRRGALDAFGDHVRFSWDLGPPGAAPVAGGTDFAVVKGGRLAAVTGFLDFAPG
ncbi:nuclear transport factor 2 family protein [Phenylobacterium sp.]|uniref:nuclear transport factor 2 family protein n=1 Tax=Phenylobacterium sp. TaxID=1871053 RepID=UPI003BA9D06F